MILWSIFFLSPYIEIAPCSLDCKKNKVADPENGQANIHVIPFFVTYFKNCVLTMFLYCFIGRSGSNSSAPLLRMHASLKGQCFWYGLSVLCTILTASGGHAFRIYYFYPKLYVRLTYLVSFSANLRHTSWRHKEGWRVPAWRCAALFLN